MLIGLCGIAAAFPLSLIFTNTSVLGRWVFGGVVAFAVLATALSIVAAWFRWTVTPMIASLFMIGCVACLASTWLGNVRAFHKRR